MKIRSIIDNKIAFSAEKGISNSLYMRVAVPCIIKGCKTEYTSIVLAPQDVKELKKLLNEETCW